MQSLLWEGPTIRIFPVAAPGAEIMRMVGPSLELIDLVNGSHEGLSSLQNFVILPLSKAAQPNTFAPSYFKCSY